MEWQEGLRGEEIVDKAVPMVRDCFPWDSLKPVADQILRRERIERWYRRPISAAGVGI